MSSSPTCVWKFSTSMAILSSNQPHPPGHVKVQHEQVHPRRERDDGANEEGGQHGEVRHAAGAGAPSVNCGEYGGKQAVLAGGHEAEEAGDRHEG